MRPAPLLTFLLTLSLLTATEAAADRYDQMVEKLSQAIASYKELSYEEEAYDVVFRRDPMRALIDEQGHLVTSVGLYEGLWVQGTIWAAERPLAIIEGELYAEGDTIDQYMIREVRQDGVILERGDETQFIPLDRGIREAKPPTP